MANEIQKLRESMERSLEKASRATVDVKIATSPCGKYRMEIEEFITLDGADLTMAIVYRVADGVTLAKITRNDSRCFYAWMSRAGRDYLLFPEDLEGQTVVDLTSGEVAGFSSPDGGFIWTEFHPSPDRTKVAIVGCYWACLYQVTVYDFRHPLNLPLLELAEFNLPDANARFAGWVSESSLRLRSSNGVDQLCEIPVTE